MSIEISEETAEQCIDALSRMVEDTEHLAAEAQMKADAGEWDSLVYDYSVVAQTFRQSAEMWKAHRNHLITLLNGE